MDVVLCERVCACVRECEHYWEGRVSIDSVTRIVPNPTNQPTNFGSCATECAALIAALGPDF